MGHVRQSRPNFGLAFHVKVFKTSSVVPSSLGNGAIDHGRSHGTDAFLAVVTASTRETMGNQITILAWMMGQGT